VPAYEETLNADLPTIPLITIQHCTNNFSETSKLGEGGFGSVYKVFMIWNFYNRLYDIITFLYDFSLVSNFYREFCQMEDK